MESNFAVIERGARAPVGVYLGDSVIIFNPPNLANLMSAEGRVFEEHPEFGMPEHYIDIVKHDLGRADADALTYCELGQALDGHAVVRSIDTWAFDGERWSCERKEHCSDVDELCRLLALNETQALALVPPLVIDTSFDEEENGYLRTHVDTTGVYGALNLGPVYMAFNGLDQFKQLSQPGGVYTAFDGDEILALDSARILLTSSQADALRAAAAEALDRITLHQARNRPLRIEDAAFTRALEFLQHVEVARLTQVARLTGKAQEPARDVAQAASAAPRLGANLRLLGSDLDAGEAVAKLTGYALNVAVNPLLAAMPAVFAAAHRWHSRRPPEDSRPRHRG